MSSISKVRSKPQTSTRWRHNLVYFGPLTKVIDRSFDPHYKSVSKDCISGAERLCSLKISLLLEGDDSLLTLPHFAHISHNDAQKVSHLVAM